MAFSGSAPCSSDRNPGHGQYFGEERCDLDPNPEPACIDLPMARTMVAGRVWGVNRGEGPWPG